MGTFYKNYVLLCAAKKKSPSGVAREIGLSNAAATGWKNGKQPNETTLIKIANYFDVSTDCLLGQEKKTVVHEDDGVQDEVTEQLMQLWNSADEKTRDAILAAAKMFASRGD